MLYFEILQVINANIQPLYRAEYEAVKSFTVVEMILMVHSTQKSALNRQHTCMTSY